MRNLKPESMYVHLGEDVVALKSDIVGVFDLDSVNLASRASVLFLQKAEDAGKITYIGTDIPRSFVVTANNEVYMCILSAKAITKRIRQ